MNFNIFFENPWGGINKGFKNIFNTHKSTIKMKNDIIT